MEDKLEVRAFRETFSLGPIAPIKLYIVQRHREGGFALAEPLTMKEVPIGLSVDQPTCCISINEAQALMDDLWTCGLRPTEGAGSAGAMAAVQKHLEDMRLLVFDKKPKDLKEAQ